MKAPARQKLLRQAQAPKPVAAALHQSAIDARWAWFNGQGAVARTKAAEKVAVIEHFDRLVALGATRTVAAAEIARLGEASTGAVWKWLAAVEGLPACHRLPFLAPSYAGGRPQAEIDPQVLQHVRSDYLRLAGASWASCYRRVCDWAKARGLPVPDSKTLLARVRKEADAASWWLSAADIARSGLPGLPKFKRRVNELAAAEGWAARTDAAGVPLARRRAARGGGTEYHVSLLPAQAQKVLSARRDRENDAEGDSKAVQLASQTIGDALASLAPVDRRKLLLDLVAREMGE